MPPSVFPTMVGNQCVSQCLRSDSERKCHDTLFGTSNVAEQSLNLGAEGSHSSALDANMYACLDMLFKYAIWLNVAMK